MEQQAWEPPTPWKEPKDGQDADEAGYEYKLTGYAIFCGFMVGLLRFTGGYNSGAAGIFAFSSFNKRFYPDRVTNPATSVYCSSEPDISTVVFSAVFIPCVFVGALASSITSRHLGRLSSIQLCCFFTIAGAVLQLTAVNTLMLLAGRCLLGLGNGFNEHVSVIYLAELAPAQLRGKFVGLSVLFPTIGITCAQLIYQASRSIKDIGWLLATGTILIPAGLLLLLSPFMVDTPSSLLVRGRPEAAQIAMLRLRGVSDVSAELADLELAAASARRVNAFSAWGLMFRQRCYWPPLIVAIMGVTFNAYTGNAAGTFYSSTFFRSFQPDNTALINAAAWGVLRMGATVIGMLLIDRLKRRTILLWAAAFMIAGQAATAALFAVYLPDELDATVPTQIGVGVTVTMMTTSAFFMGGQSTVVAAVLGEVTQLEIRPVAWVVITLVGTVVWGLVRLFTYRLQLCAMKWGIFAFYGGITLFYALWAWLLVPEASRVPLERVQGTFLRHSFWGWYYTGDSKLPPGDKRSAAAAEEGNGSPAKGAAKRLMVVPAADAAALGHHL